MIDRLREGACHLWCWPLPSDLDESTLQARIALLDDQDLARYHRYLIRDAARIFLASRILLRSVLSVYWNIKPADWRFTANESGRPRISNVGVPGGLDFNLSHKPGFVLCLVGYGRQLGIDVEDTSVRRPHLQELADRFFSPIEAVTLRNAKEEHQLNRFYELWTLKESYIKARGQGLQLGLSKFFFSVEGDSGRIQFEAGFDDQPERWDFQLFRTYSPYLIATAIEVIGNESISVELHQPSGVIL